MAKRVLVEETGKGLKLLSVLATVCVVGGILTHFNGTPGKPNPGVAIFMLGLAIGFIGSLGRWWRHG